VLTAAEIDALERLLDVILPSTSGAGARTAGSIDYVVARLDREDPVLLAALQPHLLVDADPQAVVAALAADPTSFDFQVFRRVRAWAWEGFLCEPRHGGNRDGVGWRRFGANGSPQPRGYTPDELAVERETR
jgi:hypothetical protein